MHLHPAPLDGDLAIIAQIALPDSLPAGDHFSTT